MKLAFSLALAIVAASGLAQMPRDIPKAPPRPPLAQAVPWKTSRTSAAAIARTADARMAALKGVQGQITSQYWFDPDFGFMLGTIKVRDARTFAIEFPSLHYSTGRTDVPARKHYLTANGREVEVAGYGLKTKRSPVNLFRFDTATSPSEWTTKLTRSIMGGIRGEAPLSRLVALASRRGSGFVVSSGERALPYRGGLVPQQRILIQRTAAAAKALGPIRIEVTIDFTRGLPVSARVDAHEKKHPKYTLLWNVRWRLKPTKFPDSDFKFSPK